MVVAITCMGTVALASGGESSYRAALHRFFPGGSLIRKRQESLLMPRN